MTSLDKQNSSNDATLNFFQPNLLEKQHTVSYSQQDKEKESIITTIKKTMSDDDSPLYQIKDLDSGTSFDLRNEQNKMLELSNRLTIIDQKPTQPQWQQFWSDLTNYTQNLWDICQIGKLDDLKELIEKKTVTKSIPIDINSKAHDQWTPLHYATNEGHYEIVQYLIQKGAFVNAITSFQRTPLHISCIRGSVEISQFLLQNGANINAQDKDFQTPLHYASQNGFYKLVQLLLIYKPNIDLKNYQQMTQLDCASDSQIYNLIEQYQIQLRKNSNDQQQIASLQYSRTNYNGNILKNSRSDHVEKLLYLTRQGSQKVEKSSQSSTGIKEESKQNPPANQKFNPTNANYDINIGTCDSQQLNNNSNDSPHVKKRIIGPDNFVIQEILGKGAFGQVYLVKMNNKNQDMYAMKVLQKEKFLQKNLLKYAKTERNILRVMKHPFIVSLNYAFQTDHKLYLVMDFCPGGDLNQLLEQKIRLKEDVAKIYICEIILALEALHKNCIIFRDLKPSNVVLDVDGHACLTDFGLSKEGLQQNIMTKSFCGSFAYLAPEMVKKQGHGYSIDWYLLGVLLYELVEGMPPFYDNNRQILLNNIVNSPIKFPQHFSEQLKSLIKQLLDKNPETRLGARFDGEEIRSHSYFSDINWNDVYNRKLKPPKVNLKHFKFQQGGSQDSKDLKITFTTNAQELNENYISDWSFYLKKDEN